MQKPLFQHPKGTRNVYVIRLDNAILSERKFVEANPDHRPDKPCVYVGSTGRTPQERFLDHKRGHKSARFVRKYGVSLIPRLFTRYNPMTNDDANYMEKQLARRLRKRGYAVWQN